jgi:hypothetical protein
MGTSELHRGSKEDPVIEAVLIMLGIGATCGVVLSVASKVFYVWEDPRIAQIEYYMSGANCGGCGFAGCSAAANAIVGGKASPGVCILASAENVQQIAGIMGVDAGTAEKLLSINDCLGDTAPLTSITTTVLTPARRWPICTVGAGFVRLVVWVWAIVCAPVSSTPSKWAPKVTPW